MDINERLRNCLSKKKETWHFTSCDPGLVLDQRLSFLKGHYSHNWQKKLNKIDRLDIHIILILICKFENYIVLGNIH